ncbi:MAG: hypothetical protein LZF61_05035 [Nitrosomonas sp.]|nr:MAG: hypothetical protein LZF61_05035 [Nitrosomonas sp.]
MNRIALSILRLLSDGAFHTADELVKSLKITNSILHDTFEEHIFQETEINFLDQNYQWNTPIKWLDRNFISTNDILAKEYFDLQVLDIVNSTNTYLAIKIKKKV